MDGTSYTVRELASQEMKNSAGATWDAATAGNAIGTWSASFGDQIDVVVSNNDGMGMRREDVEHILTDNQKVVKHGSGVGLINVHTRIKLMFGDAYGLIVESEPDEGTTVTVRLPAILYTKENLVAFEKV